MVKWTGLPQAKRNALLTEEQWERVLLYYCVKGGRHLPSLMAAKQFQGSMQQIQRGAGHSREQFREVSQALLDMAQEGEPYKGGDGELALSEEQVEALYQQTV